MAYALRSRDPVSLAALATPAETRVVAHPAVDNDELPVTVYRSGAWSADCGYARVLGYPDDGLIKVECRLAALLAKNSATRDLATPWELADGSKAPNDLAARLLRINPLDADVRGQRLDLTTDVRFRDPAEGCEFLWATQHLHVPR